MNPYKMILGLLLKKAMNELLNQIVELAKVLEIAEEISKSVPAFDDERVDYVEIQISKEDLKTLKEAFKK